MKSITSDGVPEALRTYLDLIDQIVDDNITDDVVEGRLQQLIKRTRSSVATGGRTEALVSAPSSRHQSPRRQEEEAPAKVLPLPSRPGWPTRADREAAYAANEGALATALDPAPSSRSTTRRTYGGRTAADRRAERRERLMAAGLQLFGTEGYANASIEKLCTYAGVSTRNFYEEFHSREDLLIALHSHVNEGTFRAVAAAFADAADAALAQRLELAVRTFINSMASDPRWARLAYVEMYGVSDKVEKHRLAWRKRWWDFMVDEADRAVLRGEAKPRDFTMPALAVIASVNELVHHYATNRGRITLDEVITEVVRFAVAAVTAEGGAGHTQGRPVRHGS